MFEESTDMDLKTFLDEMDSGHDAVAGSGVHLFMRRLSQEALKAQNVHEHGWRCAGAYHQLRGDGETLSSMSIFS